GTAQITEHRSLHLNRARVHGYRCACVRIDIRFQVCAVRLAHQEGRNRGIGTDQQSSQTLAVVDENDPQRARVLGVQYLLPLVGRITGAALDQCNQASQCGRRNRATKESIRISDLRYVDQRRRDGRWWRRAVQTLRSLDLLQVGRSAARRYLDTLHVCDIILDSAHGNRGRRVSRRTYRAECGRIEARRTAAPEVEL